MIPISSACRARDGQSSAYAAAGHLLFWTAGRIGRGGQSDCSSLGDALAERVALFDLVVQAPTKRFNPRLDRFKPGTDALELIFHGVVHIAELALGGAGEHVYLFDDSLDLFFEAVEAFVVIVACHRGKYTTARPANGAQRQARSRHEY